MKRITWMLLLGGIFLGTVLVSIAPRQVVEAANTVTMNYTVLLENGTVYDSTVGRKPLEVTLGQSALLPNFEKEVIGMRLGESKTFSLTPDQAYGEYRPNLVGTMNRSQLGEGVEPAIGKQVQTQFRDGRPAMAIITAFTDTTVTLDANHPLAGQTLTFKVQVVAIDNNSPASSPKSAIRNWLWPGLGAILVIGAFVSLSIRKRQHLPAAKKSAGALYNRQSSRAQHR